MALVSLPMCGPLLVCLPPLSGKLLQWLCLCVTAKRKDRRKAEEKARKETRKEGEHLD